MRLRKLLPEIIPDDKLQQIPQHITIIGEIAILTIHQNCEIYYPEIIKTILFNKRNIKTIVNKISKVNGQNRVASFQLLYGSETVTSHKEAGFSYLLDIMHVFFNPRLCSEHIRIAEQVHPGEKILIPFCGIGPFVIPAAAKGAEIIGVEINPYACSYAKKNAKYNHLSDQIEIVKGDSNTIVTMLDITFDRIIIPAPYGKEEILFSLLPLIKKNGELYLYLLS